MTTAVRMALIVTAVVGVGSAVSSGQASTDYAFTTLAGQPSIGGADGAGSAAHFRYPAGVAVDSAGIVYVADTNNHTIRRITPAGVVSTFAGLARTAGSQNGVGSAARFYYPIGLAVDASGVIYVAEAGADRIRKITPAGEVSTFAGSGVRGTANGFGTAAEFFEPSGIAVGSNGVVYVADTQNHTIRRITPSGDVTTLAGLGGTPGNVDGAGSAARFRFPGAVAVDAAGTVFVADSENHKLRAITSGGSVSSLTANGTFAYPRGITIDAGGTLYVASYFGNVIQSVTSGVITPLAGSGAPGSADDVGPAAQFRNPWGVAVAGGFVFVADTSNHAIRKITLAGAVTTLAGVSGEGSVDGTGSAARFDDPSGVAVATDGTVYVADRANSTVRMIATGGVVTTIAGTPGTCARVDATGPAARFCQPAGVAVDAAGDVYVADTGNGAVRKISGGVVTTLATGLQLPVGIAVDATGLVFVAVRNAIVTIGANGVVTAFAGVAGQSGADDGTGTAARFAVPVGMAFGRNGTLFVADSGNHTIRAITPGGVVTTLAGIADVCGGSDGPSGVAEFCEPYGLAINARGNLIVTDGWYSTIREVTPAGVTTTVGGVAGDSDSTDGVGATARFASPKGAAIDASGRLYVADAGNDCIRVGTRPAHAGPARLVDLDGNGGGDVFLYKSSSGGWAIQNAAGSGGFTGSGGAWSAGFTVTPARFNDDTLSDLFLFHPMSGQWFVMVNSGAGSFTIAASGTWWAGWQRHLVDLNGDGLSDLFLWDPASGTWFKVVWTGSAFSYTQAFWSPGWELYRMRFNGDALQDFFLFNRTSGQWFRALGSGGSGFTYPVSGFWSTDWQFFPGDYNGDGVTDMLLHRPATGFWFIATSGVNSFTYASGFFSLGWSLYPLDLDANDRTDLFMYAAATGQWFELLSTGTGAFNVGGNSFWSPGWNLYPTDFNDDGRGDLMLYNPTTGVWFQARNLTLGTFSYSNGIWDAGLTIVAGTLGP